MSSELCPAASAWSQEPGVRPERNKSDLTIDWPRASVPCADTSAKPALKMPAEDPQATRARPETFSLLAPDCVFPPSFRVTVDGLREPQAVLCEEAFLNGMYPASGHTSAVVTNQVLYSTIG